MIKFDVTIMIEKPAEEVFRFVADGENSPLWNSAVRNVRKISEGPVNVGTRYSMVRELSGRSEENIYEVVEYEENKTLSIKIISGPTPFLYRYHFTQFGDGTRLSMNAEVDREGLVVVLGAKASIVPEFVLASFLKEGVLENLRTLKKLLESKT